MQTKVLLEKVNAMCREPVAHRGLTLWDVTFEKEGPRYLLTVVVDKESGFWLSLPGGNIFFTDGSIMLSRFAFVNRETLGNQDRLHA